jgi:hypothetical protein
LSALTVFPIAGCNDVRFTPETATLDLVLTVGGLGEDFGKALDGVQVCESEAANCEQSDANGDVSIELPVGAEVIYTLEKQGYALYLTPDVVSLGGSRYRQPLPPDDYMAAQHGGVGSPYPMRFTGTILISTDGLAGATFDLVGATGKPFYATEAWEENWSTDLTATTSTGMGGFTEVTPGEDYQVKVGGAAQRCVPLRAWPSEDEDTIRVPVREGYISRAFVRCAATP